MRIILKGTFILTLLFAACIGLIRAQPYDDSQLRAFLTPPEGCPMPCFMGIRPGVTTADEAIAILESHEWVGSAYVSNRDLNDDPQGIIFTWSGRQPEFIPALTNEGYEQDSTVLITDNIVSAIWIPTRVPLGNFWMLWGTPDEIAFTIVRSFNAYEPVPLLYGGFYSADVTQASMRGRPLQTFRLEYR